MDPNRPNVSILASSTPKLTQQTSSSAPFSTANNLAQISRNNGLDMALVCQKCASPLLLDADFSERQPEWNSLQDALTSSNNGLFLDLDMFDCDSEPEARTDAIGAPVPRFGIPPTTCNGQFDNPQIDKSLQIKSKLFYILSKRTNMPHPLCQDCADALISTHRDVLEFQENELQSIQAYVINLDRKSNKAIRNMDQENGTVADYFAKQAKVEERGDDCDSWDDSSDDEDGHIEEVNGGDVVSEMLQDPRIANTKLSEVEALCELLEKELQDVLEETAMLEEQAKKDQEEFQKKSAQLDQETLKYNECKLKLLDKEEQLHMMRSRENYAKDQYERLKHTNVLLLAFRIWQDNHIGVINDLHLGRLPNKPIEWTEINFAWGYCALLMHCLSQRTSLQFENFEIVPKGDQSFIKNTARNKDYPLFYTSRIFKSNDFDLGMISYLDCMQQLSVVVQAENRNNQTPNAILEKHKLMDASQQAYSIKYNGNTEENWTRGLNLMLQNLKWLMCEISSKNWDAQHNSIPANLLPQQSQPSPSNA